jgi:hypothetical protein
LLSSLALGIRALYIRALARTRGEKKAPAKAAGGDGAAPLDPRRGATERALSVGSGGALDRAGRLIELARERPLAPEGRAARLAAERVYVREAARLRLAARSTPPAEAKALDRAADDFLARALATRLYTLPRPLATAAPKDAAAGAEPLAEEAAAVTSSSAALTAPAGVEELLVSATPGAASLTVVYETVATATKYEIRVTPPGGTPVTVVQTVGLTFLPKTVVTGLANEVTYLVEVIAYDPSGAVIGRGDAAGTPTAATVPPAPIVVTALPGDKKLTVAFTTLLAADSYDIVATQLGPSPPAPVSQTKTVASGFVPSVALTPLINNTEYLVTVTAKATGTVVGRGTTRGTPTATLPSVAVSAFPDDGRLTATYSLLPGSTRYDVQVTQAAMPTPILKYQTSQTLSPEFVPFVEADGLTNDIEHTVHVSAFDEFGTAMGDGTAKVTPRSSGTLGLPFDRIDPLGDASAPPQVARLLTAAHSVASRWRYEYLKKQVLSALDGVHVFDEQITQLQMLDVEKTAAAEPLLTQVVTLTNQTLSAVAKDLETVPTPNVERETEQIADAVNSYLLLEQLLAWLTTHDALEFWVGLFGRIIDDLAAFDWKEFPRTRAYLRDQFNALSATAFQQKVLELLGNAKADALKLVDDLGGPLRVAAGQTVARVAASMQEVFDSFDEPLLVHAGTVNESPLGSLGSQLQAAVDDLVERLRDEVEGALDMAADPVAASKLFELVVMAYVVLPILAALAVGLAGGPISAVLLAAAVTVAAQELLHLIARWLQGPVQEKLDEARAKVDEGVEALRAVVADALSVSISAGPAQQNLNLLAGQLGNLANLLPKEYLDEAAALLAEARDAVVRSASQLALAAEQALGLESGTAFDVVSLDHLTNLPLAPQLAGGVDSGRFAAASLLRQLDGLERARLELRDAKEVVITQRLSLFKLLGGSGDPAAAGVPGFVQGELGRLLHGEEVAVRLTEGELIDKEHPGLYRALLVGIRAVGVFDRPPTGALSTVNIPLHLTHAGESRTRVKTDANRNAPKTRARWGSARLVEDRDPHIAALGFATLAREHGSETAVFNLFPEESDLAVTAAEAAPDAVARPRDDRYGPFENFGLEGTLLLYLPASGSGPDAGRGVASDLVTTSSVSPRLVDILLDVTFRACHDTNLAAAVRATREKEREDVDVVGRTAATARRLSLAGVVPAAQASNRRTIHFSLRGHRDDTLRLWQGALGQPSTTLTAGADWTKVPATQLLETGKKFEPLPYPASQIPDFTLAFGSPPATVDKTGLALSAIGTTLTVTPEMLGIPKELLTSPTSGVVGLSISVVPTPDGVLVSTRPETAPGAPAGSLPHPIDVATAAVGTKLHVVTLAGSGFWTSAATGLTWDQFSFAPPAPAGTSVRRLDAAAIGNDLHVVATAFGGGFPPYRLLHTVRSGVSGPWSPWTAIPQPPGNRLYDGIACATDGTSLYVLASTFLWANGLWTAKWTGGTWSALQRVGPSGIPVPIFYPGEVALAYDGTNMHAVVESWGSVYHGVLSAPNLPFSDVWPVPEGVLRSLGAAVLTGKVHLCADTWNRGARRIWHLIVGQTGWKEIDPPRAPAWPDALALATVGNDLRLVVGGYGADLHHGWYTNGKWYGYQDVRAAARTLSVPTDPLDVLKLNVPAPLDALVPGYVPSKKLPGRLVLGVSTETGGPLVPFSTLFTTGAAVTGLVLTLSAAVTNGLLYDVIVSLTYTIPVETITPALR